MRAYTIPLILYYLYSQYVPSLVGCRGGLDVVGKHASDMFGQINSANNQRDVSFAPTIHKNPERQNCV